MEGDLALTPFLESEKKRGQAFLPPYLDKHLSRELLFGDLPRFLASLIFSCSLAFHHVVGMVQVFLDLSKRTLNSD